MEKYSVDGIAVEVCPMSNYRLGYVDDLRLHPALTYLRDDIPVVICSDDGLPDDEKDSLMRAWEAQWAEFIKIYSQAS